MSEVQKEVSSQPVRKTTSENLVAQERSLISDHELSRHIRKCTLNKREHQKKIYGIFFGYAMDICNRYTSRFDEAVEIVNNGFLKIFKGIGTYQPSGDRVLVSFTHWLKEIIESTAIAYVKSKQQDKIVKVETQLKCGKATGGDKIDCVCC